MKINHYDIYFCNLSRKWVSELDSCRLLNDLGFRVIQIHVVAMKGGTCNHNI